MPTIFQPLRLAAWGLTTGAAILLGLLVVAGIATLQSNPHTSQRTDSSSAVEPTVTVAFEAEHGSAINWDQLEPPMTANAVDTVPAERFLDGTDPFAEAERDRSSDPLTTTAADGATPRTAGLPAPSPTPLFDPVPPDQAPTDSLSRADTRLDPPRRTAHTPTGTAAEFWGALWNGAQTVAVLQEQSWADVEAAGVARAAQLERERAGRAALAERLRARLQADLVSHDSEPTEAISALTALEGLAESAALAVTTPADQPRRLVDPDEVFAPAPQPVDADDERWRSATTPAPMVPLLTGPISVARIYQLKTLKARDAAVLVEPLLTPGFGQLKVLPTLPCSTGECVRGPFSSATIERIAVLDDPSVHERIAQRLQRTDQQPVAAPGRIAARPQ